MKKPVALLLISALLAALCACSPATEQNVSSPLPSESSEPAIETVPEYSFLSLDKYARDGKDCVGYRVAIGDGATEEEMRAVFDDLCSSDDYYLHTVWFYGLPSDVETIGSFSVGMLEETSPGEAPEFTPCTYGAELIASMREQAAAEAARLGSSRSIPSPSISQEALVPDNLFFPVDEAIFTTTAEENGLVDSAFFVEGEVVSRSSVGGYDTIQVSTEAGEVYVSAVLVPLPEISEGEVVTVFFLYQGFSDTLGGASGVYVYHE